jgi:hypothetical protein
MKKYLVLFGAAILVMAWAVPSMAQRLSFPGEENAPAKRDVLPSVAVTSPTGWERAREMKFQSYGHIEIQTIWEKRPDFNTGAPWTYDLTSRAPGRDVNWKEIAERYRFYLQYGDPKTVRAVLGFEADSQDYGELAGFGNSGNNSSSINGGTAAYSVGSNHIGVYRSDSVQLEVKHAYVDFTIPNTPVSISAGIQFFEVGGRMFMNNDAAGIIVTANFAPHRIRGVWWRQNDNNRGTYGVNDTYALTWDMTQPLFSLAAWGAYKNDLYTGQFGIPSFAPINVTTTSGITVPVVNTVATPPTNKWNDNPWYVGAGGGFRPGNWSFSGDAIYNGGKRQFTTTTVSGSALASPVQGDSTYQGYAAEVAASYRIGPGLLAGLEGFYASGQNADKPDKITLFEMPTSSETTSNFGNDRTVFMWMNAAQMGYYHNRQGAYAGFWYGRANVEYSPLTWVRMNLNFLYIGDTDKGTPGNGISPTTRLYGLKTVNTPVGARQDVDKSYVGSELNLITTLRIYQNFDYNIGLYGFFPSDMFDQVQSNGQVSKAQTSYGLNTKLVYAF